MPATQEKESFWVEEEQVIPVNGFCLPRFSFCEMANLSRLVWSHQGLTFQFVCTIRLCILCFPRQSKQSICLDDGCVYLIVHLLSFVASNFWRLKIFSCSIYVHFH